MRAVYLFFSFFMLFTVAKGVNVREPNSKQIIHQRRARETQKRLTDVVSLTFCDSSLAEDEKMSSARLEDVHTYAELKDDPRASLPDSFTIFVRAS